MSNKLHQYEYQNLLLKRKPYEICVLKSTINYVYNYKIIIIKTDYILSINLASLSHNGY